MRRAFIACGGTGGHLSPGIALAEEMVRNNWRCSLLVSNKQVDSRLVRKYTNFDYQTLSGSPFVLSPLRFLKFARDLVKGTYDCIKRIKAERPDVVIGFGGFLSMPALLAGRLCGVPVAIHEANRVAGRVTRIVSLFAHRVYLPKGVGIRTAYPSRIRYLGMPVRREIQIVPKARARHRLGLAPDLKTLVVVGGSQGAESLNNWVRENLETFAQREIQVYCLTGDKLGTDSSITFRSPKGVEVKSVFCRFSDDMATVLSAADLVVSRAGAGSIAEIQRCRIPAILVPYPYAADNHQYYNALNFEKLGCGVMVGHQYLSSLVGEVKDILYNEWLLQKFADNQAKADRRNPQAYMTADLGEIAANHSRSSGLLEGRSCD